MSDADSKPSFDKGDRAAIINGPKDVGVRGAVFWVGENKYGPGMRYGLRGDDGTTYWVDDNQIGKEEDAPPAPEKRPVVDNPGTGSGPGVTFAKGDSVKIIAGSAGVGSVGDVFWSGASKYGEGMRYGVRVDEDTYWVDGHQVEAAAAGSAAPSGGSRPASDGAGPAAPFEHASSENDLPEGDLAPEGELPPHGELPTEDNLPPEAFDGEESPPEGYGDDIPF